MEVPAVKDEPPKMEKEVRKPRKYNEEKGSRKKDEKTLEAVLKSLSNISSPTEKFDALCKKFSEILDDSKRTQLAAKVAEKKLIVLQREKDQLQGEQTKSVLGRNRLELLCRELQRQNKVMKEESLQRIREEEERRKEVSAKFHATLAEITALMQQNTESNSKLRDENLEMQNQFKGVCEQYELREQQVEKISKQMKLEGQLAEAKLAKAKLELQAQKEILERDKAELMAEVAMCQKKCLDHEKTEESLRAQVNVYFQKYDEFQSVLTKSNQVYSGFKTEMEKMSKKITRLEKETSTWKQKWESTHKALLALAAEKQLRDAEVALQARQLTQLQKLCRTIQGERQSLLQQLSAAGMTPKLKAAESPEKDSADNLQDNLSIDTLGCPSVSCNAATSPAVAPSTTEPSTGVVVKEVNDEKTLKSAAVPLPQSMGSVGDLQEKPLTVETSGNTPDQVHKAAVAPSDIQPEKMNDEKSVNSAAVPLPESMGSVGDPQEKPLTIETSGNTPDQVHKAAVAPSDIQPEKINDEKTVKSSAVPLPKSLDITKNLHDNPLTVETVGSPPKDKLVPAVATSDIQPSTSIMAKEVNDEKTLKSATIPLPESFEQVKNIQEKPLTIEESVNPPDQLHKAAVVPAVAPSDTQPDTSVVGKKENDEMALPVNPEIPIITDEKTSSKLNNLKSAEENSSKPDNPISHPESANQSVPCDRVNGGVSVTNGSSLAETNNVSSVNLKSPRLNDGVPDEVVATDKAENDVDKDVSSSKSGTPQQKKAAGKDGSPNTKGNATPATEQKKGKEGGRRRKK